MCEEERGDGWFCFGGSEERRASVLDCEHQEKHSTKDLFLTSRC